MFFLFRTASNLPIATVMFAFWCANFVYTLSKNCGVSSRNAPLSKAQTEPFGIRYRKAAVGGEHNEVSKAFLLLRIPL